MCFIFLRINIILIQKVRINNFLSFGINDFFALELCEFIFESGCSFAGLFGRCRAWLITLFLVEIIRVLFFMLFVLLTFELIVVRVIEIFAFLCCFEKPCLLTLLAGAHFKLTSCIWSVRSRALYWSLLRFFFWLKSCRWTLFFLLLKFAWRLQSRAKSMCSFILLSYWPFGFFLWWSRYRRWCRYILDLFYHLFLLFNNLNCFLLLFFTLTFSTITFTRSWFSWCLLFILA